MPTPTRLAELLKVLGLDFKDPNGGNSVGGNPAFAVFARIRLPDDTRLKMPPVLFRSFTPAEEELMIAELKK